MSNGIKNLVLYLRKPFLILNFAPLLFFNSVEKGTQELTWDKIYSATRTALNYFLHIHASLCIIILCSFTVLYSEHSCVFISSEKSYGFLSCCGRIVFKKDFQLNAV